MCVYASCVSCVVLSSVYVSFAGPPASCNVPRPPQCLNTSRTCTPGGTISVFPTGCVKDVELDYSFSVNPSCTNVTINAPTGTLTCPPVGTNFTVTIEASDNGSSCYSFQTSVSPSKLLEHEHNTASAARIRRTSCAMSRAVGRPVDTWKHRCLSNNSGKLCNVLGCLAPLSPAVWVCCWLLSLRQLGYRQIRGQTDRTDRQTGQTEQTGQT